MARHTQTRPTTPRLPDDLRRSALFSIRLTPDERATLTDAWRQMARHPHGPRSEGELVRDAISEYIRQHTYAIKP